MTQTSPAESAFDLMRRRRFWANMGLGALLVLMGLVLGVCSSCQSVPEDTFKTTGPLTPDKVEDYGRLVAEGRDLYEAQPRNEERLRRSVSRFDQAMTLKSDDYDTLWQGARSCAWLAAYAGQKTDRVEFSKAGLRYAQTALKVKPAGTEGLFYFAVLSGRLGENDNSYGLDAVTKIEESCKKIIESGADVAYGGAHRVYGMLLLRAPAPPTSIGSLRNARKQLEAALAKAPDWPENHLCAAEMEFAWAKDREKPAFAAQARERLQKYLLAPEARTPQGHEFEFERWKEDALKLLAENR